MSQQATRKKAKKSKKRRFHFEIPVEIIAVTIALAKQQHEAQRIEPTSLELALFDDVEVEHSAIVPEHEVEAEHSVAIPVPKVEEDRTVRTFVVVTSPFKPPTVAYGTFLSSSTTASFADPELAKFEAMDLDAQLDKLEKLSSTPGKAKSKALDKVVDRVRIWQSTELDLDENKENMAPRPILKINLGLARDVLNLHNHYEDLKPSVNASEFYRATHEDNLADYKKQKAKLDVLVADYKETKSTIEKLEKHIEELQKQLAGLREK
ncbi:unnamed protein product [Prunus armeniaca]